jgi:hypothetical protein
VKIASLLEKLKLVPEIQIEKRIQADGKEVYIFSATYPFPRVPEPAWYVIVLKPGQDEVDDREIEAMLRHLWMFQLDLLPIEGRLDSLAANAEEDEQAQ